MSKAWNAKRAHERADFRRELTKACLMCRAPLAAQRDTRRFCSDRCRVASWRLDRWYERKSRRLNEAEAKVD